ncbi:MAG: alkaline phosphatase family protein [Deltaproteobacteria bacterium]|nr:alkaline phosphatase family protein [Deltaproteobacteria bacterium]
MNKHRRDGAEDSTGAPAEPAAAPVSRRQFLTTLSVAAGALAVGGCGDGDAMARATATPSPSLTPTGTATSSPRPSDTPTASPSPSPTATATPTDPEDDPLPAPAQSGIQHIVVVMMENRSFDHFLGWLPGADGRQAGLQFRDRRGTLQQTHRLAPEFQSCASGDPDHSYEGGRIQFAGGANDGWLLAATDDLFPLGYFTQSDLAFFGTAVPAWTTFDRYFCAILGPTFPNRFYMHAAQTDRLTNTFDASTLPTIWDRLAAAGLSGRYYFSDLPVLALWGDRFTGISTPIAQFFTDAAAGTLPQVSYVDPRFLSEELGTSNDDHPFADIRNGQAFMSQIYDAVTASPNWPDTVLIFTYDEWGGFFDHVSPPLAPRTGLDDQLGNDGRLGFRVPCVVVSPLARRSFIGHRTYDHTSILKLIEWRWDLAPLSTRDATATNLAHGLDFTRPKNLMYPRITVPAGPFGEVCEHDAALRRAELQPLRVAAARYRFPRPDRARGE